MVSFNRFLSIFMSVVVVHLYMVVLCNTGAQGQKAVSAHFTSKQKSRLLVLQSNIELELVAYNMLSPVRFALISK